jgi:hypothetical protein
MAVPTDATDVFAPVFGSSGVPAFKTDWFPDFGFYRNRTTTSDNKISSRLQGIGYMDTTTSAAETTWANVRWDWKGWIDDGGLSTNHIAHLWKRAPNYFDVVAYTGTGSARTVSHNLGVAPEMIWFKSRSDADNWVVYVPSLGNKKLYLNLTNAITNASGGDFNDTAPTDTVFSVGDGNDTNRSGGTHIAYLFASLDGVSKVGSYTGNGTSQNIDCGFSSGARFVLIKRSSNAQDWYIFDSTRGIVSGNDPYLKLNTTDSEAIAADEIDPLSSGFTVNQTGSAGINFNGHTYIFYAIA